jgi:hypothetical protein
MPEDHATTLPEMLTAIQRQFLHLPRIDVPAHVEMILSISGASPVTITDSCIVDGTIWKFTTACCATISSSSLRVTV